MDMRAAGCCFWAALLLAPPLPARAWSETGHRIVGAVAERLLTPEARWQAAALLADDPDTLTAPDLVSRTAWADRRPGDDTRAWHLLALDVDHPDFDAACFGHPPLDGRPASAGPAQDCVVDKVEQFAAELGDPAQPRAERRLALKFLLNLVADLHQPLRAADRRGALGNDALMVSPSQPVGRPLGAYWDAGVVEAIGSDPQAIANDLLMGGENETAEWSGGTPRDWALEAFDVARKVAYRLSARTEPDRRGTAAHRLDIMDEIAAVEAARQQLARAGVRLAVLLNAALR